MTIRIAKITEISSFHSLDTFGADLTDTILFASKNLEYFILRQTELSYHSLAISFNVCFFLTLKWFLHNNFAHLIRSVCFLKNTWFCRCIYTFCSLKKPHSIYMRELEVWKYRSIWNAFKLCKQAHSRAISNAAAKTESLLYIMFLKTN